MGNQKAIEIIKEVKKAVKGKDEIIEKVMMVFLAKGHVLMEDIPGVGKTTLALAFAKAMKLLQKRTQFTTDVLPSDVVGFSMYNEVSHEFEYHPGAIMCNLYLADEINRTSSKTQAALLEAMEEGKITVDGVTRDLPAPFVVIATQNPTGSAGTQLLPESQLDRFMVKLSMGYPDVINEAAIMAERQRTNPIESVAEVADAKQVSEMQEEVSGVYVAPSIYEYIAMLSAVTRKHPMIELGVSPRGSLAVARMTRAHAFLQGRDYATPEDVKAVFADVIAHRIILNSKARVAAQTKEMIIKSVFMTVPVPRDCRTER